MPFVLFFIGVLAVVIGVRGQASAAGQLLASEFTGSNSFIQWFLAIMIIGLIGYWDKARPVSDGALVLLLVVMVLAPRNGNGGAGLFVQLEDAFQNATPISAKTANGSGAAGGQAAINNTPLPAAGSSGADALNNAGTQLVNLANGLSQFGAFA